MPNFETYHSLNRITFTDKEYIDRIRNNIDSIDITIPSDIDDISPCVYHGNGAAINNLYIGPNVTLIDENAFAYCKIRHVVIDNNPELIIRQFAFSNCEGLESVVFKNKELDTLGFKCFSECYDLKTVSLPFHIKYMESHIFQECHSLSEMVMPITVNNMGIGMFYNCDHLKDVRLPMHVDGKYIPSDMFHGCSALNNVVIPDGYKTIHNAFYGCTSLDTITIPSSVENIWNAFTECKHLDEIKKQIPSTCNYEQYS